MTVWWNAAALEDYERGLRLGRSDRFDRHRFMFGIVSTATVRQSRGRRAFMGAGLDWNGNFAQKKWVKEEFADTVSHVWRSGAKASSVFCLRSVATTDADFPERPGAQTRGSRNSARPVADRRRRPCNMGSRHNRRLARVESERGTWGRPVEADWRAGRAFRRGRFSTERFVVPRSTP